MNSLAAYDLIIWDFNGTILDDVWHGISAVNTLLSRRNLPTIDTLEHYYSVFGFPIEDYYRRLGLLDVDDYPTLAAEWIKEYRAKEDSLPARKDAVSLLSRIAKAGKKQSILSATETEMLKKQLSYLGLTSYFAEVLGRKDYYAADKSNIAVAFRQANPTLKVLMIGDTDHDFKAAQMAGFDCALVAGGHQSLAYLQSICKDTYADFTSLERELFA